MDILIIASDIDIPVLKYTVEDMITNMKPSGITIVTSIKKTDERVINEINDSTDGITKWIDEDELYPGLTLSGVREELLRITGDESVCGRAGWYFQQFLKMAYAFCIKDNEYFQMDADVLLLRPLPISDDGKPVFFVRKEHNTAYFDTIYRLFGINKQIKLSFISETMLFKTDIMREIINKIESNESLQGEGFWRRILHAVDPDKIKRSGFSEYETYGTFVLANYPDSYSIRSIPSLRSGKRLLGCDPSGPVKEWAARSFFYVGIEKWDKESVFWKGVNKNPVIRTLCPARLEAFIDRNLCRISRRWRDI